MVYDLYYLFTHLVLEGSHVTSPQYFSDHEKWFNLKLQELCCENFQRQLTNYAFGKLYNSACISEADLTCVTLKELDVIMHYTKKELFLSLGDVFNRMAT